MRLPTEIERLELERETYYEQENEKLTIIASLKQEQIELKLKIGAQDILRHYFERLCSAICMRKIHCETNNKHSQSLTIYQCQNTLCCANIWKIHEELCRKIPKFELDILSRICKITEYYTQDISDRCRGLPSDLCCIKLLCRCENRTLYVPTIGL